METKFNSTGIFGDFSSGQQAFCLPGILDLSLWVEDLPLLVKGAYRCYHNRQSQEQEFLKSSRPIIKAPELTTAIHWLFRGQPRQSQLFCRDPGRV